MSSPNAFFDHPILNSPYEPPRRHWELDADGQPTQQIIEGRRPVQLSTPVPKPGRQRTQHGDRVLGAADGLSSERQEYQSALINQLRQHLDQWRRLPENAWRVTPETARLLKHWRHHEFQGARPFFCQLEAVETAIWLTEVASASTAGKRFTEHLSRVNEEANPQLSRLALKLATGSGKTTVMAMLIAWQTVNAVRRPAGRHFTRGFLVVAPGLTVKDRLRVLQPNDAEDYYSHRELVPADMLEDIKRAKIVITNYHAFKLRERMELSAGGRALLRGRIGAELQTTETAGQMIQRVMPELMGMKNVMVLNDEAHHCYREKRADEAGEVLKGDEKREAATNNEAARLWMTGLESVNDKLGISRVIDLSATPFFLRGSGYAEGTLFQWTLSDFSLMDAIECGIVKLPRVPIADSIPEHEMPTLRNLWQHIGRRMPRKGRGKADKLDPRDLPPQLLRALDALYEHYQQTFELWEQTKLAVPPCFIIVCNNTSTSKLMYDYISGYVRQHESGGPRMEHGALRLFRNHDEEGNPLARPRTLLIDSEQLESGEQDLLREMANTVGKPGRPGADIRCVVSVSMLTEGWDASTVTHVLGARAFGTQLLCEQVIGRALRRQSYDLNEEGRFDVEYADVLGIPFDFTAEPSVAPPQPPRETIQVKAVRPDRDALEIRFPRVEGYRTELPDERLIAEFNQDSVLEVTPDLVNADETQASGIIGAAVDFNLLHTVRPSQVIYELTSHLLMAKLLDGNGEPRLYLFGQLKRIVRQWLDRYLICTGGTYPAHLKYRRIADQAAQRILTGLSREYGRGRPVKAMLDAHNPVGSTAQVRFNTSKKLRWQTSASRCHVNWAVLDSEWQAELCRVVEWHPRVRAYVKNHNLGFEVPYRCGSESRRYLPDFIVLLDDGHGEEDLLRLVIETGGYCGVDVRDKSGTMEHSWVPAVNQLSSFGRWAFAELGDVGLSQSAVRAGISDEFDRMITTVIAGSAARGN